MHVWRGVLTHATFLLAQPTYLALRYALGHENSNPRSFLSWAIHASIWFFIATRISIPFFRSPLRFLPSPPGEKFLLCHLNFNGGKPPTGIFERMINSTPNDGLLVVWLPLYLSYEIIPTRPDALMDMLNTHNYDWQKPPLIRKVLSAILGEGLVNVEGDKHKAMRRVVAPSFSGRQIRDLVPLFWENSLSLADVVAAELKSSDDQVLKLEGYASRASLDIIGMAGIGMDFNTLEQGESSSLAQLYQAVSHPPAFFMMANVFLPSWVVRRLWWFRKTLDAQSKLRDEVGLLLQQKKTNMKTEKDSKDIVASINKSGDFSDEYLMSQLLTFLAAGHDTSTSGLLWTVHLLSLYPEIQTRLRTECQSKVSSIHSNKDIDASIFDSASLPLLSAVLNESLRLYPPAPGTARISVRPTTINNIPIPANTSAHVSPWAVNRSVSLWGADATKFKPERWLEGPLAITGGAESPQAFLTFLYGPRSCIGQSFARLELKCLIAALVMRFRFESVEGLEDVALEGFVTIKPEGGFKVRVVDLREGD